MTITFLTGLILGATAVYLLLSWRVDRIQRSYRNRLAAAWTRLHNQDVYINELQQRLDRQQRVWIYAPDTRPASNETGPTSGVPINWN